MRSAYWSVPLCLVLVLSACGTSRPLAGKPEKALEPRSPSDLLEGMLKAAPEPPRYYKAKAEISFTSGKGTKNFKAYVRVVHDSAAWLSVVPLLGIEVARVLLTRDSLLLMDKLHDTYWKGDTGDVRKRFGVQPGLGLVQDALLGRPIGLDPHEKYRSNREDGMYTLTSRERRRFLRAAEDLAPGDTLPNDKDLRDKKLERTLRKADRTDAMVYKYWTNPDSMRVARVSISDLAHDQRADVRYLERTAVDGMLLPTLVVISLSSPGQTASGTLRLDRIERNGPLNLPFRIPEKFKPMD